MKKLIISLFWLLTVLVSKAQDIGFSQLFETPMLRNPSLSGLFNGDWRVSGSYRTQWNSVTVPYISQAASAILKLAASSQSDGYFSIGTQFVSDKAGDLALTRNQFLLAPTYHLYIGNTANTYLSGSLMIGSIRSFFNRANAQLDDQFVSGAYSPSNPTMQPFNNTDYSYFDISAGMALSGRLGEGDFYLGAALFHANRIGNNEIDVFQPVKHKWVLNGGMTTPVNDAVRVLSYVDYSWQSGNNQLFMGAMLEWLLTDEYENMSETKLSVGAFFRLRDSYIPYARLQWRRLSLGFSFDKTASHLNSAAISSNSMELTLSYVGLFANDRSSLKRTRCPRSGAGGGSWFFNR